LISFNTFRKKLYALVTDKKLNNEELKFISLFNNDKELLDWLIVLNNDTTEYKTIPPKTKDILKFKKTAIILFNKILNKPIY
jgi:hypothetical protein